MLHERSLGEESVGTSGNRAEVVEDRLRPSRGDLIQNTGAMCSTLSRAIEIAIGTDHHSCPRIDPVATGDVVEAVQKCVLPRRGYFEDASLIVNAANVSGSVEGPVGGLCKDANWLRSIRWITSEVVQYGDGSIGRHLINDATTAGAAGSAE